MYLVTNFFVRGYMPRFNSDCNPNQHNIGSNIILSCFGSHQKLQKHEDI